MSNFILRNAMYHRTDMRPPLLRTSFKGLWVTPTKSFPSQEPLVRTCLYFAISLLENARTKWPLKSEDEYNILVDVEESR